MRNVGWVGGWVLLLLLLFCNIDRERERERERKRGKVGTMALGGDRW